MEGRGIALQPLMVPQLGVKTAQDKDTKWSPPIDHEPWAQRDEGGRGYS